MSKLIMCNVCLKYKDDEYINNMGTCKCCVSKGKDLSNITNSKLKEKSQG